MADKTNPENNQWKHPTIQCTATSKGERSKRGQRRGGGCGEREEGADLLYQSLTQDCQSWKPDPEKEMDGKKGG